MVATRLRVNRPGVDYRRRISPVGKSCYVNTQSKSYAYTCAHAARKCRDFVVRRVRSTRSRDRRHYIIMCRRYHNQFYAECHRPGPKSADLIVYISNLRIREEVTRYFCGFFFLGLSLTSARWHRNLPKWPRNNCRVGNCGKSCTDTQVRM